MQLFIDNWSASLLAPATAEAVSLSVEPSLAARLVGLGEGDFYELTLVEHDAAGLEIDWEVVTVTGRAAGVLAVTRSGTARAWASGTLIEARLTASAMETLRDAAGGTTVGSSAPQALGSASAGTSPQASRQDHVHPAPTAGDIGAATAAQGDKADSAVQPAALTAALAEKVDKVAGKGLSSNDYTTAEKNKLAGLEGSHFKGLHASLAALQSAQPSAMAGDYADVDAGAGVDVVRYLWDVTDSEWVAQAASGGSMTAAQVKTAYESNPDTNAFTDAEQAKLGGIAPGATANANTDSLAEGATNKYFTEGRVRGTVLTGLSLLTGGVISAADSVLSSLGKLQKQISDAVTAISGKQDTLVSGTNIKTVNGSSLLGGGDLSVSGGATSSVYDTATISAGTLSLNLSAAQTFGVSLTENVTDLVLAGATSGQASRIDVLFAQTSAGGITVDTPSDVILPAGTSSLVSTTANNITLVSFLSVDGGAKWLAERRGVFTDPRAYLPAITTENESFFDDGTSTTGWSTDYGSPTISIVSGALRVVGANSSVKKTISAPASGDFINYIRIKGSKASGQYWSVCFNQGATPIMVLTFGYNWVTSAADTNIVSVYSNAGAEKKVLMSGVDYSAYVEFAIHYDTNRSVISIYAKDADDMWDYITHLAIFAGLRTVNTLLIECGTATSATVDMDYALIASPNIVSIGDSLCSGANHFDPNPAVYGGDDDNATTWQKHSMVYRNVKNNLIVNKGIGSQTSTAMLARIAEATAHSPQVVFLHASSNDQTGGVSQATRTSNMQSMVDACVAIGAEVVILNAAYPNSDHASGPAITAYNLEWWEDYLSTLTDVHMGIDIMQPVLSGGVMDPAVTESDGIHPTAAGYELIGEYIATFE